MKESLRMQKVSKIRITTICATKTTSDLGIVTLLQNFHDFFHCLSRYKQTLLLLLRQVHLLLLLLVTFEKLFFLQSVLEFFSLRMKLVKY